MNWTVQQKIRIGFWLLPILPVIFCFIFIRTTLGLIDSNDAVARTGNIMRSVLTLQSGVKDLEVTQREYILSGDTKSLKDYEEDKAVVLRAVKDLQQLSKGDEVRARYIDTLADVIPQKFEELQKTIDVRRSQGASAASELLLNEHNKPIEDIERLTNGMLKMETERHKESEHSQSLDLWKTILVFVAILILNMLLVWFLRVLIRREAAEARREEERIRMLNAALETKVAMRTEALRRSNEDLQQFAYVASHDLQEPLRMVGSYITLLQRRYEGKLDKDADDFINFAVDGVKRMGRLIQDLLEYSRANEDRTEQMKNLNTEEILATVLENLTVKIEDTEAYITHDPLPAVVFDSTRMMQILQNLIGNALKYRGTEKPRIHISGTINGAETIFSVKDNGLGIDPKFHQQIFGVFQRLHGREYEGSGIGLAMVKRIVERYGGRIWVESTPGEGSTFSFTILNQKMRLAEAS